MTYSKTNAVHETMKRDEEIKGSSDRAFGMVFTVVFLIVGLWPLMGGANPRIWALIVAGLILAAETMTELEDIGGLHPDQESRIDREQDPPWFHTPRQSPRSFD